MAHPCPPSKRCVSRIGRIAAAALLLSLTLGCSGSDRPKVVPVTGVVTYRGQPLSAAQVMFMPQKARPATGTTDAEGRFRLSTFEPRDGAVIGHHAVTISKWIALSNEPYAKERSEVPAKYSGLATSGLEADVTAAGPNDVRFDLTDAK